LSEFSFPQDCIVGSLGECALTLAEGTEIPPEGIFAALLTFIGAAVSGSVTFEHRFFDDTRLYTMLIGDSATAKKSSAITEARKHVINHLAPTVPLLKNVNHSFGAGSGEGLARILKTHPNTVLIYDEIQALMQKMGIESSSLLTIINSLYHEHVWSNLLKDGAKSEVIENARLSLIGCATSESFETLLSSQQLRIGFGNRFFIVGLGRKPKVANPLPFDMARLDAARQNLVAQLALLPCHFAFNTGARKIWADWYENLNDDIEAKRLDAMGFRLLPLIALITDSAEVDENVAQIVIKILQYEHRARMVYYSIDAENASARMEQKILSVLKGFQAPMKERVLQQRTNASRAGLQIFKNALRSLHLEGFILLDNRDKTVQLL